MSSPNTSTPGSKELRQLRAQAHSLRPVVTVAGKGLAPSVLEESERALNDHELIKVKVAVGDRDQREVVITALCNQTGALLVNASATSPPCSATIPKLTQENRTSIAVANRL